MIVEIGQVGVVEAYRLLVGIVTPRPIAWVTSVDREGRLNLAPFSFFNAFGANPPVVVFSPLLRRDGSKKDTLLNVEATGEFVLNGAVEPLAQQVNLSSTELPYGESEVDLTGLALEPSLKVRPPRLRDAPTSLECRVLQVLPIGTGPLSANLVIGEVLVMHIADALLDGDGQVDPRRLKTIGRLGRDQYCRTTDIFEMPRPR